MHACMNARMYGCMYVPQEVNVVIYVCIFTCIYKCISASIHVWKWKNEDMYSHLLTYRRTSPTYIQTHTDMGEHTCMDAYICGHVVSGIAWIIEWSQREIMRAMERSKGCWWAASRSGLVTMTSATHPETPRFNTGHLYFAQSRGELHRGKVHRHGRPPTTKLHKHQCSDS